MASRQARLVVRGKVQGVFFRASTEREAVRLGLDGWVKNRPDGCVELVAQGNSSALDELIGWAKQGPSAARVDEVEIHWEDLGEGLRGFRIVD